MDQMTFDEVVALYRDRSGMSEAASRNEAIKNSMNPGAALMYLTGTDQIHQHRRKLVNEAGRMDVKTFHDRFLAYGSAPVSLIGEAMTENTGEKA